MGKPQGGDGSQFTVPKFSSFKPAKPVEDETHKASSHERHHKSRDTERDRHGISIKPDKTREYDKRLDERSSRRDEPKRHQRRSPSPPRSHHRHKRLKPQPAKEAPEPKRAHLHSIDHGKVIDGLYTIDTKGDSLLKKYGNNVHYHVPPSFRYPPGRVLGAEGRLFIHRDGIREEFSILQPGETPESSRHKDGLRHRWPRAYPNPTRLQPQKTLATQDGEDLSYLQIRKPKTRSHIQSQSDTSDDEARQTYRSIEGKMKAKPVTDEESDSDSDGEADVHQDNPLRWRSVQLSKQVKERPEDIDTWLELVDHQNTLLKAGQSIDHSLLEAEVHSYGEIKVSLLESALSNARNANDRKRILVPLMREGTKVWDRKTSAKRWAGLSDEEKACFELWKTHLNSRMSDIANFQYEEVRGLLLSRLKALVAGNQSSDPTSRFEEAIYVFLRATRLISDAGYRELALSAWQALFELNFWRPAGNREELSSSLELFQEFWESEVPRFGEVGAQGWCNFIEIGEAGEPMQTPASASTSERKEISRDPYKVWAALELERGREARMPARTLDEGNDDDPFRVVMFSDVEQLIFFIPPDVLGQVTEQIVDAFLIFSGLPPALKSSTWTDLASQDPYIVRGTGATQVAPSWEQPVALGHDASKRVPHFKGRMLECSLGLEVLLPGSTWFHYLPMHGVNALVPWDFMELALKQIAKLKELRHLGPYLLALSYRRDPQNIKTQAKSMLKQDPTNIALYAAYALAEHDNGRYDVAQKTMSSAAKISSGQDLVMLVRNWAWMHLTQLERKPSLRLLCSIADADLRELNGDQSTVTSSQILKVSQALDSGFHAYLNTGSSGAAALYGECLLLLSYLTSTDSIEPSSATQGGIEAAMEMSDRFSNEFSRRSMRHSSGHEKLLQATARILNWHAANGPFRRSYMQEKLASFVDTFPRNSIFLALLEWCDSGLRVIDETRQLLHERCLQPAEDVLTTRVFAIQHEMERGNSNSTLAAFEDAIASGVCRVSPFVWAWYIHFSYSQKSLRHKAKDIFYRALRHCPWSKEIMMQGFTTLVRSMESDELKSVYETMTSKGMRIHVELDDFLQQHETKRARERGRR